MGSRRLALGLAFGVPFVAYVLTSGGLSYWLDSGEFVAAAERLDIAHPPGHPLSELYGKLFALLLPLGSITWRVAVGQAFATALASMFLCIAIRVAVAPLQLGARLAWASGVFGAWLCALSYGLWFQAVRAEVYALQTLCMAIVIQLVARLERQRRVRDVRPLYGAALALGFGLANHHLIAFLVAPALLPCVVRVLRARGIRPVLIACGFGLLALATYAYLPVRALARPAIDLGDPRTLDNFAWVVSARVYSQNLHLLDMEPMSQRFSEVAIIWVDSFHWLGVMAAIVGLYVTLRHPPTRRHALLFGLLWFVDAGVRGWMGSVRANPDILGYLAPGFLATGALGACAVAMIAWVFQRSSRRAGLLFSRAAWLLPLLALLHVPSSLARSSLATFAAPDAFDELRVRELPPRSVVVATTPQTAFRHWELDAVDRVRPDLVCVPLSFLRYPGTAERLAETAPFVASLEQGYLLGDVLRASDLVQLAAARPVFVELDTHVPVALYPSLAPQGLLSRVLESSSGTPSLDRIGFERQATYRRLYARIGRDVNEVETARQLLWLHYMDTLYFAARGRRDLARKALGRALSLHPEDVRLHQIRDALADPNATGALDVTPYLDF